MENDELKLFQTGTPPTTGINNNELNKEISFFPNPAKDSFTFNYSNVKQGTQLTIYNLEGKAMLTKELLNVSSEVDVSTLNKGVYFVRVKQNNKEVYQSKLILE